MPVHCTKLTMPILVHWRCIQYFGIIFAPLCLSERLRLARLRIALPLHSAFTLPLRTAAASMNLSMEAFSISSSFAQPLPKQSFSKIIMSKYTDTMPMYWIVSLCTVYWHYYCTRTLVFAGKIKISLIWNFP